MTAEPPGVQIQPHTLIRVVAPAPTRLAPHRHVGSWFAIDVHPVSPAAIDSRPRRPALVYRFGRSPVQSRSDRRPSSAAHLPLDFLRLADRRIELRNSLVRLPERHRAQNHVRAAYALVLDLHI